MFAELWNDLRYRVRALVRRDHLDRDLRDEIDAHIARQAEMYRRQGLSATEARRRARIDFGGVEDIKASARDARGTALVESLRQDLREALRALRTGPSFAVAVTLALAVGIGGSTATFIATKAVLRDPLPWPDDERLVMIWAVSRDEPTRTLLLPTAPEFLAWQDSARLFESVGTVAVVDGILSDTLADPTGFPAEELAVDVSSAGLLETLGVAPLLGRVFTAAEDAIDAQPAVALIGRDLWQRRFGGRPDILGRTIGLDGIETTIIGVMPDGVTLANRGGNVWAPVKLAAAQREGSARGWPVVARLKPGVSLDDARAEANAIAERLHARSSSPAAFGANVEPLRESRYATYARVLGRFESLTTALFLAACANVAGLLLMRAAARRTSLAIRSAVGAGRGRLLRQFVIEALTLTTAGGLGAIGVAWLILEGSSHMGPTPLPHASGTPFDATTVLYVGATSLLAALLVIPPAAIHVARVNPADALPVAKSRAADPPGRWRFRSGLVVAQIALAMVLLVGVGLLATTFVRIDNNALGGDPKQLVTFTIRFPPAHYRTFNGSYDGLPWMNVSPVPADAAERLRQRLEQTTGVTSAAVATRRPFVGDYAPVAFDAHDATTPSGHAAIRIVSPRFFETMRIPIVSGRDFTGGDDGGTRWVAIVNAAMARQAWGDGRAIGRTLHLRHAPDERPREVVGVVGDTRPHPLATENVPAIYLPLGQQPHTVVAPRLAERLMMTFVVRTTGDPVAIVPEILPLAAELDPTKTPDTFQRLEDAMVQPLTPRRHLLMLLGAFTLSAVALAAAGIYGAVTDGMARQAREISIRRAFGASRSVLWRMVIGRLGWIVAPGIAIGTVAAIAVSHVVENVVWGVSTMDPMTYAAASLLIVAIAVAIASVSVRRVLSTSPNTALNGE